MPLAFDVGAGDHSCSFVWIRGKKTSAVLLLLVCGYRCFYLFFLLAVPSRKSDGGVAGKCQDPVLSICLARHHHGARHKPRTAKSVFDVFVKRHGQCFYEDSSVVPPSEMTIRRSQIEDSTEPMTAFTQILRLRCAPLRMTGTRQPTLNARSALEPLNSRSEP